MDMGALIVPQWYVEAKAKGLSDGELKKKVAAFCLEALQRRAARTGQPAPDHVDNEVIDMTQEMYEHALSLRKEPE